jgi:malate dehydrogenase
VTPTPEGDWYSVGICSDGSYGIEPGIISSFPVRTAGYGREVVQNIVLNDFSREKINASISELLEEKALVSDLLG